MSIAIVTGSADLIGSATRFESEILTTQTWQN